MDARTNGFSTAAGVNQVNFSIQQCLQRALQPEVGIEKADWGVEVELHQEIDIAARGIEVVAASRGAKNLQPPHMKSPAYFGDLRLFVGDQWVHVKRIVNPTASRRHTSEVIRRRGSDQGRACGGLEVTWRFWRHLRESGDTERGRTVTQVARAARVVLRQRLRRRPHGLPGVVLVQVELCFRRRFLGRKGKRKDQTPSDPETPSDPDPVRPRGRSARAARWESANLVKPVPTHPQALAPRVDRR